MKKYILIIEDDEDIQEIYKEMVLNSYDVDLGQQYNGRTGLEAVKERKPDLIILDLLMPVMNGDVFLRAFREEPASADTPVIICSVNQTLAQQLLREGKAQAVLPKLFMEKDLLILIERFLGIQRRPV